MLHKHPWSRLSMHIIGIWFHICKQPELHPGSSYNPGCTAAVPIIKIQCVGLLSRKMLSLSSGGYVGCWHHCMNAAAMQEACCAVSYAVPVCLAASNIKHWVDVFDRLGVQWEHTVPKQRQVPVLCWPGAPTVRIISLASSTKFCGTGTKEIYLCFNTRSRWGGMRSLRMIACSVWYCTKRFQQGQY
jgi:hypothetical protein